MTKGVKTVSVALPPLLNHRNTTPQARADAKIKTARYGPLRSLSSPMPCDIHPASNGRAALAALTVHYWRKTPNSNRTPVKVPAAFQAVPVRLPG